MLGLWRTNLGMRAEASTQSPGRGRLQTRRRARTRWASGLAADLRVRAHRCPPPWRPLHGRGSRPPPTEPRRKAIGGAAAEPLAVDHASRAHCEAAVALHWKGAAGPRRQRHTVGPERSRRLARPCAAGSVWWERVAACRAHPGCVERVSASRGSLRRSWRAALRYPAHAHCAFCRWVSRRRRAERGRRTSAPDLPRAGRRPLRRCGRCGAAWKAMCQGRLGRGRSGCDGGRGGRHGRGDAGPSATSVTALHAAAAPWWPTGTAPAPGAPQIAARCAACRRRSACRCLPSLHACTLPVTLGTGVCQGRSPAP